MTEIGKEIWQSDAEAAFAEAEQRIAAVLAGETEVVVLTDLWALEEVPASIQSCSGLKGVKFSALEAMGSSRYLFGAFRQCGLEWLSHLRSLVWIDLSGQVLEDLTYLSELSELRWLDISRTEVSDVSPLEGLSKLEVLDCDLTKVSQLDPLSRLTSLRSLNCQCSNVSDLAPLSRLKGLQRFQCNATKVSDISPLAELSELQGLTFSETQVADLSPLSRLTAMKFLAFHKTLVSDLAPLAGLTKLQYLICDQTDISDISALKGLSALQEIDLSLTCVSDLASLTGLTALQSLRCRGTKISDLAPLAGLITLEEFSCSSTSVSDLAPMKALTALRYFDCNRTKVSKLAPLAGLAALESLECGNTDVTDLSPVCSLKKLRNLRLDHLNITSTEPLIAIVDLPDLDTLIAEGCRANGIPSEVLSTRGGENCLPQLRAHIADLGPSPVVLSDVKLMVLGNGRIGKTQICNRLRGMSFDAEANSTHGITVASAKIPDRAGVFNIWDFGGQDIYHATHSLFLSSRAVFLMVWTPESDNSDDTWHDGMVFRNRPMAWWLDFVKRQGNSGPLIAVQNQVDVTPDKGDHKDVAELRKALPYCRSLPVSAKTNEGLAALREALGYATDTFNPPLIGPGRKAAMDRLRAMRHANKASRRVLPFAEFDAICAEIGGVNDVRQFLHFLDAAGEVFWREGLFDNAVVLDQAWMLEGVYSVFDREKCYRMLEWTRGRFDREVLAMLVWDEAGYSDAEQEFFLSCMEQSGIAFPHSVRGKSVQYIAPDLLPEAPENLAFRDMSGSEEIWRFEHLPRALMRNLISLIGRAAGPNCHYWRHGLHGYDTVTGAKMLIEQTMSEDWSGEIRLVTDGKSAKVLAASLKRFLNQACEQLKLSPVSTALTPEEIPCPRFARDPERPASYFVSYAWSDETDLDRDAIVSDICARAEAKGINVQRDESELKPGDRISEFMARLTRGDRIFVVLSEKYLRSRFCMTELHEIWREARGDETEFLSRVRSFALPDAKIWTAMDRARIARHWKDIYESELEFLGDMGPRDRIRHHDLKKFATHVGEILETVVDVLQPKDVVALEAYVLD